MIASWYIKLLATSPGYVMAWVTLLAVGSSILTGLYVSMPDFSDPTLGFETRGTDIAVRSVTWNQLFRPLVNAASLFQQPKFVLEKAHSEWEKKRRKGKKAEHAKIGKRRRFHGQKSKRFHDEHQQFATRDDAESVPVVINDYTTDSTSDAELEAARLSSVDETARRHSNESKSRGKYEVVQIDDDYEAVFDNESDNDVWPISQSAAQSRDQQARHDVMSLTENVLYNFCNEPSKDHARVGMKRIHHNLTDSMFEVNALRAMCALELQITALPAYQTGCEKHPMTPGHATCCHRWSLPSYVAMISQVPTCNDLQPEHLVEAENLLKECRHYYLDGRLRPNCWTKDCNVPKACRHNNAAYNMLHYLMNMGALDEESNGTAALNVSAVLMIMPFGKSSLIIDMYEQLRKSTLINSGIGVVAMDLGMDDALFDQLLVHDSWYIFLGGLFILICIWFYTRSFLMTLFTLLAILYSLSIAVFVYKMVLKMEFFPFMNVLAVLVNVGIGADDVFIYISMWRTTSASLDNPREEHLNYDKLAEIIRTTLRHAAISMGVTSLTTALAFFTTWFNSITTIKCFGLFASITVVCNYLIMLTWIPATVSLLYRLQYNNTPALCCGRLAARVQRVTNYLTTYITTLVTNQRLLWIFSFSLLCAGSFGIVFVYPRFRLSSAEHFRMFAIDHPFEVYKREFSNRFYFDNVGRAAAQEAHFPLTFVWGVHARDNGVYSDPKRRGTFELDTQFAPYAVDTQQWLRKFCRNLREQPFYNAAAKEPAVSTGCIVETFDANMQRACLEPMTRVDQTPCCNTSTFPYKPDVFRDCLPDIITSVYATPSDIFPRSSAGPLFGAVSVNETHLPRHSTVQPVAIVRAIVVEFDSNVPHTASFDIVDRLVDSVQTWFDDQLANAPEHMQGGWFTSDLQFYDLQRTLYYDTVAGILISMGVACVVLVLVTACDLLVSVFAFATIIMSIVTTVAGLVLLDWRLNVLESIAISTSIGLAIDCSLHYALAYRELSLATREQRTRYALGRMIGPTAMAALTTGAAGVFMMPSQVLPYIQMGEILVLLMVVSWSHATFFLMSMLCVCGPQYSADVTSWRCECRWFRKRRNANAERIDMELLSAVPGGELGAMVVTDSGADAVAPNLRSLRLSRVEPETESESLSTPMSSPTTDGAKEFPMDTLDATRDRAPSVSEVDETNGPEEQTTSV